MRGATALVWALLVGGMLLGMMALFWTKLMFGPDGPDEGLEMFSDLRDIDAKTRSHLEDLGVRFGSNEKKEPTLNLDNPTDEDFAFLEGILRTHDEKAKISAAKVLRDIGAPRAVGPLVAAATGPDDKQDLFMAQAALTILSDKPPDVVRGALIPAYVHDEKELSAELREGFLHTLRNAGAFDPAWLRDAAVGDRDPAVRRFALEQLAADKRPPLGVFAAALGDPDAGVRGYAAAEMTVFHR